MSFTNRIVLAFTALLISSTSAFAIGATDIYGNQIPQCNPPGSRHIVFADYDYDESGKLVATCPNEIAHIPKGNKQKCTLSVEDLPTLDKDADRFIRSLKSKNFKFTSEDKAQFTIVSSGASCMQGSGNDCHDMRAFLHIRNNETGLISTFRGYDEGLLFSAKSSKAISNLMKEVPRCK